MSVNVLRADRWSADSINVDALKAEVLSVGRFLAEAFSLQRDVEPALIEESAHEDHVVAAGSESAEPEEVEDEGEISYWDDLAIDFSFEAVESLSSR